MTATPETTPYQQHQPHDAGPTALAPEGAAARRALAPLLFTLTGCYWDAIKGFMQDYRSTALGLGLTFFVGLGGYAWQRANPTPAQSPWTSAAPATGAATPAQSPWTSTAAATGAATPAGGTVPLTLMGVGRAQDGPPDAFTPAPLRPKARGRHGYRHRPQPQPQPTFWQRLFGRLFGHNAKNQPS